MTPAQARFGALLTPQGKIIVDFIVAEAPAEDGGGFFLDCPRALAPALVEKLNFYKLRAKVICEDLSEVLGVMAVWDGSGTTEYGLVLRRPAAARARPAHHAAAASGQARPPPISAPSCSKPPPTRRTASRSACRAAGSISSMATPSRTRPTWTSSPASISTRAATSARRWCRAWSIAAPRATAIVPVTAGDFAPDAGVPVMAGDKQVGTTGSHAGNRGLAMLRLDRVADALAAGTPLTAGGVAIEPRKPDWATFDLAGGEGCMSGTRTPCRRPASLPLAEEDDPLYVAYHDDEWGVPEYDDRALFEKLVLDGFQAGLSWITILRKRDNFRRAFDGFDPEKIARYDAARRSNG